MSEVKFNNKMRGKMIIWMHYCNLSLMKFCLITYNKFSYYMNRNLRAVLYIISIGPLLDMKSLRIIIQFVSIV